MNWWFFKGLVLCLWRWLLNGIGQKGTISMAYVAGRGIVIPDCQFSLCVNSNRMHSATMF